MNIIIIINAKLKATSVTTVIAAKETSFIKSPLKREFVNLSSEYYVAVYPYKAFTCAV